MVYGGEPVCSNDTADNPCNGKSIIILILIG
jgi:hypothetical protein